MTTSYDTLNNLPDLVFIGGTDKVLTFACFESNGLNPLNITGGSIAWYLCPFGQFTINTLTKTGSINSPGTLGTFTVTLDTADTIVLRGKFIQQVIITDYIGNTFRPGQGIVLIQPAIWAG